MKRLFAFCALLFALFALEACCNCEIEPIVGQNHKLIVPPNFGNRPIE